MPKHLSIKTKCPHCGESLMDSEKLLHDLPSIKLNIETANKRGTLRLCSIYGCEDHLSDIEMKDGDIAKFYCPHCNKQLISNDECDDENCNAPMIPLTLQMGGRLFFCSRKGCDQHFVAFEDLATEIRNFHNEYGTI